MALVSFVRLVLAFFLFSFARATVPSNTTIGTFGPLNPYQPVDVWLYPVDQGVPLNIALGNASLAFSFGFQLTYGISTADNPGTYIGMDSLKVAQYTQLFNFTGNLLSNTFWWNTTTKPLPQGSYILTTSASFFACTDGSPNELTTVYWENSFDVGTGGSVPANTTGNPMSGGNFSAITAGMYDCTALRVSKSETTAGLIGTYGAGIIFTAIVMTVVRGRNPSDS